MIAPQNQEDLFEPFSRVGKTTNVKGIGLGLVVSKRWVEAHDGLIPHVIGTLDEIIHLLFCQAGEYHSRHPGRVYPIYRVIRYVPLPV